MSDKEERRIEMMQKQMEDMMARMKQEFESRKQDFDNRLVLARFDADKAMEKGREVVKERPLTYVGLAFGVGLVIGAILIKAIDKD